MTDSPTVRALKLAFTWCYLIQCPDGYLLIDTSYSKCFSQFRKSITALGIDIQDIRYLLLTHHHDDHAGFAAELVEKTGCRVIAHRHALEPLTIGESEDTMRPINRRVKFLFSLFTLFHRRFRFPPLILGENDILLTGDNCDFLQGIGINGRIVYTPGHTRDSISVILADGSAFVGDVAMNFLRPTGIGHRPIFVEDIETVYISWQRLIELGAEVIYPSHGKPFPARELVR